MERPKNQLDVAPSSENTAIGPNFEYVRTIPAILKVIEFILCLFAFALTASFKGSFNSVSTNLGWGRADFFICVMVLAWLGSIVLFIVYFMNIISKLKGITHIFLILAVLHFIGSIFVLISTALILDDVVSLRSSKVHIYGSLCDFISKRTSTSCPVYEGSGAAGFFAFIAITFDGVLHAMKGVQEYRIHQANKDEESTHQAGMHQAEMTPGLHQAEMTPGLHQAEMAPGLHQAGYEPDDEY